MDDARQPLAVRICPACDRQFLGNKAKKKHRYGPGGAHCKPDHILRREGMEQCGGVWRKPVKRTVKD